jgi:crossover junction endodeoxyribonuclease RuvC
MRGVLGIDPGLSGALAIVHDGGVTFEPMPTIEGHLDLAALKSWISFHSDSFDFAYLEQVHSMPKQGVASSFKFGRVYGAVEGMLAALGIPYELVTPQRWQKMIYAGLEGKLEGKARSYMAASRLFPNVDFRATERSKKPHEGSVEASLIAYYGRRIRQS